MTQLYYSELGSNLAHHDSFTLKVEEFIHKVKFGHGVGLYIHSVHLKNKCELKLIYCHFTAQSF